MWILIFDSEWWTIIYGLVTIVNDHESWIKILNWLFLYQGVRILVLSFSIDHFLTFYFSDCVALSRSVSVVFSNFHPIPTPTSDGLFSCLNEAASYDMNHIIWTRWKKVGSPLSPDLSSWSSKWNNFPYTSNLNVWWVLFMTNHFVTFQDILNFWSAENSLAISWKPLESYLWSFTALPISDSSGISDRNCLYSPSLTWFTSFDPSVLLLIDFNLRLSVLHQPAIKSEKEKIYDL